MKIAVSVAGQNIEDQVDPRFGRCQAFLVVDSDTMDFEPVANTAATSGGGAGIAAAQMIVDKGAEVVLTGNCGPNAFSVLEKASIQVITGVTGTVREAVDNYKAGKYQPSGQANVDAHSGSGRGQGKK